MRSILAVVIAAALTVTLGACAAKTGADFARERFSQAAELVKSGRPTEAYSSIRGDVRTGMYGAEVTQLVANNPGLREGARTTIEVNIDAVKSAWMATDVAREIADARTSALLDEASAEALSESLGAKAVTGNRSGDLPFLLTDEVTLIRALNNLQDEAIIFERSVDELKDRKQRQRVQLARSVFRKAKAGGMESPEYAYLRAKLPELDLPRSIIVQEAAEMFPEFAESALAAATIRLELVTEPKDRLLFEDLTKELKSRSNAISIVDAAAPGVVVVIVRKLRMDERQLTERTQPVMISYYDVNPLAAALLMPRGASYIYDYTEGGAEIEYAFEIVASQDGKEVHNELLRDTLKRTYSGCANARIQNVFGGVQPANFTPNDAVAAQCGRSSAPVRVQALRDDVIDHVGGKIMKIPAISEVIRRAE